MITEYVQAALDRAHYELIEDDEPFYGEVSELPGVYATGETLEGCRSNLRDVIEGWLIVSLTQNAPIPELSGIRLDPERRSAS